MILLPLEAAPADATATDFKINVAGDAYLNPVLAHILRTENGIETEEDTEETLSTSLAGFTSNSNGCGSLGTPCPS